MEGFILISPRKDVAGGVGSGCNFNFRKRPSQVNIEINW